ncbi:MAG: hypothetical protein Q4G25_10770 [Paracoccus sp. (in: a-proteobacteria)]|nr:hypothetical protein [Paracoccus sp. (in: a-proteobacteria)]
MIISPRRTLAALLVAASLGLAGCAPGITASDTFSETTLITDQAKQSLSARVASFDRDINRGSIGNAVNYLPPRMLAQLSDDTGVPVEFLRAAGGAMLDGMTREMTVRSRTDLSQALVGTTTTGRAYALIPGVAVITARGQTLTQQGNTLALTDDGQWYLIGLGDQDTLDDIRRAYPEFRGVNLPVR